MPNFLLFQILTLGFLLIYFLLAGRNFMHSSRNTLRGYRERASATLLTYCHHGGRRLFSHLCRVFDSYRGDGVVRGDWRCILTSSLDHSPTSAEML